MDYFTFFFLKLHSVLLRSKLRASRWPLFERKSAPKFYVNQERHLCVLWRRKCEFRVILIKNNILPEARNRVFDLPLGSEKSSHNFPSFGRLKLRKRTLRAILRLHPFKTFFFVLELPLIGYFFEHSIVQMVFKTKNRQKNLGSSKTVPNCFSRPQIETSS